MGQLIGGELAEACRQTCQLRLQRLTAPPGFQTLLIRLCLAAFGVSLVSLLVLLIMLALGAPGRIRRDVQIDQRERDTFEVPAATHQCAVDACLGPMQGAMVRGLAGEVAAMGLDLLEAVALGIIAIGAPTDGQIADVTAERDLAFIVLAASAHDTLMTTDALLGGRRWREAQVQIALARGKGTQFAYCDPVACGLSVGLVRLDHDAGGALCREHSSAEASVALSHSTRHSSAGIAWRANRASH